MLKFKFIDTPAVTESAAAIADEDEHDDTKDDKKKKKKKKKDKEADKPAASKTKKPGSSAIKKIRENLELLRLEQKKREEEELARQKAEEEAEEIRLEKVLYEAFLLAHTRKMICISCSCDLNRNAKIKNVKRKRYLL